MLTPGSRVYALPVRDLEVIDSELGLLLAIRRMAREAEGRTPNTARIDALLDERGILTKIDTPRTSRSGRLALWPVHSVRP